MNRQQVMTRAWAIFRQTYNYPAVPFASIGRRCFASALRMAWQEAREAASQAARIAAIPADARAARITELQRQDALAPMAHDNWTVVTARRQAIRAELAALAA